MFASSKNAGAPEHIRKKDIEHHTSRSLLTIKIKGVQTRARAAGGWAGPRREESLEAPEWTHRNSDV